MSKFIVFALLLTFIVNAEDAVVLKKGDSAPNDGILISQDKAQEIKNTTIERDGLLQINDSLNKSLTLQTQISDINQKKVQLLSDQDDKLAKSLQNSQTMNTLEKVLWFSLGFIVPVAGFYGVRQAIK